MYRSEAEDLFEQMPRIAGEHIVPMSVTGSDSGHYVIASVGGGVPQVFVSIEQIYETLAHLGVSPANVPAPGDPTVAELQAQITALQNAGQTPVVAVPDPVPTPAPATVSVAPAPPSFADAVDPNTGHVAAPAPDAAPAAPAETPAPVEVIAPTVDPNTGETVTIPETETPA